MRHKRRRKPIFRQPEPTTPAGLLSSDPQAYPTVVRAMAYGPDSSEEHEQIGIEKLAGLRQRFPVLWVDVVGLADVALVQKIGQEFALHPLTIEDVIHTHQRAKVEDYGPYHFLIIRMAPLECEEQTDQLGMFLGDGFVITFQERPGDDLDSVRERIRSGRGRIRSMGADYLVYAILDACVDAYFPILEKSGTLLEDLEDIIIQAPGPSVLGQVYGTRRAMLTLRRAIWPLREAVGALVRDDSHRFTHETRVFLRDVYDHTVQLLDLMETYRELSSNLMDVYLSSMNNRMSEVMKVLTIITTIFIPLSFIAGIYGMNFNTEKSPWNMPELNTHWGYPVCLIVMALIAVAEIFYFRRKGWIGERRREPREKE